MMMRTEVNSGLLNLNQAQLLPEQWPLNSAYLYGVYFYQFIDEVYGPENIETYIEVYSKQLIPYLLYKPVRSISEEPGLSALWEKYQIWLQKRFAQQISEINSQAFNQTQLLTDTSYYNGKPVADAQGNIYYAKYDPYKPSYLVKNSNGMEQSLTRVKSNIVIVGVNEESIWYLQSSHCSHNTQSFDLYRYDFGSWTSTSKKITDCASIIQGKILTGSSIMTAIVEDNGRQKLISLNLETLETQVLYQGGFEETLASPSFLDKQQAIILSRKLANQPWHISLFNLKNEQFSRVLTDDKTSYHTPALDQDNTYIYFTSDQDGLLEIYRANMDGQSIQTITRSLTGSINPSVIPNNGGLVFQRYNAQGWNIASTKAIPMPPVRTSPLTKPGQGYEMQWDNDFTVETQEYDYTALNSSYPRSWWFSAYNSGNSTEVGITVSGRDSLNFHNYDLGLSWDFENEVAAGMVNYTLLNHFTIGGMRSFEFTEGEMEFSGESIIKEVEDQISGYFSGYWLFDFSELQWFIGAINSNKNTYDIRFERNQLLLKDEINTGGLALRFNSTSTALQSISESFGRNIKISLEHDKRSIRSLNDNLQNTDGALFTLDWREYITVYQAHVIALRGFIGDGEEGIEPFELGGQNSDLFSLQSPIFDRQQSLRGYADNLSELSGRKAQLISVEYRFPLFDIHKGISSWPIGLHTIHGALFYDRGAASNSNRFNYYTSTGIELSAQLDLGYAMLADLSAGFAQPQTPTQKNNQKEPELYLRLSASF